MEEKIYELIKGYIAKNSHLTVGGVSLDLLNLVGCRNTELISAIIDGVESREKALEQLHRMIECYKN